MAPSELTRVIFEAFAALGRFALYVLAGALVVLAFSAVGRAIAWVVWKLSARPGPLGAGEQRARTLYGLTRSLMNALGILLALVFMLSLVIKPENIAFAFGLLSAGFGIAARPFISDYLNGIRLILRDEYTIGEKVEIGEPRVTGTVEGVNLSSTYLRSDSGELYIVPNGDLRTIRNFSRGTFSPAHIRLTIPTSRLSEGIALLKEVVAEPDPDIIEPPQIISEEGLIGETTSLMLKVKVKYGEAADVRVRLLARLQKALTAHSIIHRTQLLEVDGEQPAGAVSKRPASLSDEF
jgi:small conductance mechanosensitive channel